MGLLALDGYHVETGCCGGLPPISSISARDKFSGVPLHSRALIPKRDVKKESGKNLQSLVKSGFLWNAGVPYMTVKMVNTISDRD